ncbi:MAG: DnaJ domain-containing protein, partial [Parachlamydiaceae bacterium]
ILENHENEIFKNFISNLAQEAYSQSKVHLDIENEKIFLEVFSATFKNPDTLEAFLRFKKGYKENEFFNTKESESYAYSSFSQDELYRQLELPKNASKDEIKASYRKLTRLYHPDKIVQRGDESESDFNNRKKAGEEKFKLFSQAYKSLIDA